mgnify:CR=1 FL=1
MPTRYTNDATRNASSRTTHDPTAEQGVAAVEVTKTGTGGIDPHKRVRRPIIKPTGLEFKDVKSPVVQQRLEETRDLDEVIRAKAAREFFDVPEQKIIEQMSIAEIDAEIGTLLRKQMCTEEEELLLFIVMAAST